MHRVVKIVVVVAVFGSLLSCTVEIEGDAKSATTGSAETSASARDPEESGSSGSTVNTLADVAVGDCIEFINRSPADVEVGTLDCADPDAVYEVAAELPSPTAACPTDRYDRYQQTGRDEFALCLMLNAEEGECFDGLLVGAGATGPVRADCAAAGAVVTRMINGEATESACAPGTPMPLAYSEPAPGRTVCVDVPRPS
ncbi:hypothetical protein MOQ72_13490 [Saccharopolyspora sp. K220]|uniref:LppU/SCO3897 family protein n=1 Tax=Saccharopolyspora soli TaxID=2926618 RepID=UPI001F581DCC|nr:hypothetical protein [Saccharopolyspora soli]MCI2418446.1 hypothetical protein [Saccharopolyspora soli]